MSLRAGLSDISVYDQEMLLYVDETGWIGGIQYESLVTHLLEKQHILILFLYEGSNSQQLAFKFLSIEGVLAT